MATTVSLDDIQGLYIAYFNRPADFSGLKFWQNAANANGGNLEVVANAFSQSPEYTVTFAGKSNFEIVNQIYLNLFGRSAELDGLTFWSAAIDNGLGVGRVAYQILKGAQNADKIAVDSKIAAATAFYGALDTTAEVIGYSGTAANAVVKAWLSGVVDADTLAAATTEEALDAITGAAVIAHDQQQNPPVTLSLTAGVDTLIGTAGNDTFVAGDGQLTALDSIDGGAGVNSLNVGQTASLTIPTGVTLKNIQTVNLTTGGNLSGSLTSAVNTLNLTAVGNTNVTANAATDVNQLTANAATTITGGKNVAITQESNANSQSTNAAGNVTINAEGGAVIVSNAGGAIAVNSEGTVTSGGGTSLTTVSTDAVSYATQQANIAAASATQSALTAANTANTRAAAAKTGLETLQTAVNGATTLAGASAATRTALDSGFITAAQKASIDSAFATGLATNLAAAVAAAGTIYNPLVQTATAAATTAAAAATAAATADTAADAVVTADAAAGVQAITSTSGNTKLASVSITGNYSGSADIKDNSAASNVLTTVSLNNASSANLDGNAISTVNLKDYQGKTVAITNATAAHALTLNADNVNATVTDTNAGTLNIVSNGSAANTVAATTSNATAVNLSGAAALTLSGTAFAAASAVITSTGAGARTLSVAAGQQYQGGAGVDTITTGNALQTAAVNGGAGTADKVVLTNNANFATTGAALYSGFEIVEVGNGVTVDVTRFTNSAFTSVVLNGGSAVTNLSAALAGNVTVASTGTINVGVAGAETVGQIDTVRLTIDNGQSGRQAVSITPTLAGVETVNIVNNENTTITSLTGATALTNLTAQGAGSLNVTTGALSLNVNTVIDASANTGAVTINAVDATTNGLRIVGSTTAANTLTGSANNDVIIAGNGNSTIAAGAGNNTVTAGNGTNSITATTGNDTITAGNGNNTINAGAGNNTITVGNGYNSITTGSGNDIIKVGTGGNVINSGAGADVITLGAHTLGTVNTLVFGASTDVAGTNGVNMDTVTGFLTGLDKIQLSATSLTGLTLTTGATLGTLQSALNVSTSVTDLTAVYTQLGTALSGLAASADGAGNIVARQVVFSTGDAAGTYLVINDGTIGFQGGNDIVVKLVGNTAFVASDLTFA